MVEGIFQIMESMEPSWITLNVLEIAAVRFPDVDRETLRLTIMTVMMSQRRCVVRLTRAGLRLGPRTDREEIRMSSLTWTLQIVTVCLIKLCGKASETSTVCCD